MKSPAPSLVNGMLTVVLPELEPPLELEDELLDEDEELLLEDELELELEDELDEEELEELPELEPPAPAPLVTDAFTPLPESSE